MDRPEPGLVKWSPNPQQDSFIHINLQHRVVQLYEPTGHAQKGRFDFAHLAKHDDFPPLTTYDWSPAHPGLLAVGTGNGIVNFLRIDDGSNAYVELGLKMARTCHAVAFSSEGLLAVGLDRVRMDQCLHVWDVNRLSPTTLEGGGFATGFPTEMSAFTDPAYRLEPSVSVSSVRFFEDNPNTLVVGIKGQGLRIHDLREPGAVVNFQTKCNNNLTIDFADQNYFASSALDQPGVMIWDRRAISREVSSQHYLQAVDEDDLPWGSALRLDRAIETDQEPTMADNKHSLIRSMRFCRDHRGLLAILSRTGQLKILNTRKEFVPSDVELERSPELLHVHRSNEMDAMFAEGNSQHDRIVSFDWINTRSPVLRPRMLVLRASGALEVLEQPSPTSDHLFKLVRWKAPHRGFEEGGPYQSLMDFEPNQRADMLGPILVEDALADIPLFGPNKVSVNSIVEKTLAAPVTSTDIVYNDASNKSPLPALLTKTTAAAEKMRSLREYANTINKSTIIGAHDAGSERKLSGSEKAMSDLTLSSDGPPSCRELHENLLTSLFIAKGLPREAQSVLDHIMLLRAREKYLFDARLNRKIVDDDPWLGFLWDWIADAETSAAEGGLVLHPLDLTYMGVQTLWANDLGLKPSSRLPEGSAFPDATVWERCAGSICKRKRLRRYDGVETKRPFTRQLCLEISSWGVHEHDGASSPGPALDPSFPTTRHTMATARALFRGDTAEAVEILKQASTGHPELLFVSLALQLMGRGGDALQQLDFDESLASKTDPYLRAISTLVATGDWKAIANQKSLPLSDRAFVAVRNLDDEALTTWLVEQVDSAAATGDLEGIVLTGITDRLVDVLARYVQKFQDVQTATLVMSFAAPRYVDDVRCRAWRNAYRAYLQRHKAFFPRTKFEVESTKRSKRGAEGRPTVTLPPRQIALRCVYCDAEYTLKKQQQSGGGGSGTPSISGDAGGPGGGVAGATVRSPTPAAGNPLMATSISAGMSCPNCGRHLPRCVVCLEIVGIPRSDKPEASRDADTRLAARFPTFCLKCEHVLHLDHARQWFARHVECPVPECRCRCNFRANPELNYR